MYVTTARQIGTRLLQLQPQSTPNARTPGLEDLTLQFRSCYKAFQTGQFPPVVEYSAHAAFHEVCATHIISGLGPSSECQLLKKVLYDIALLGTGQAFRELQTEIHPDGQFATRRDITQPTLGHGPWEFTGQPITCSYGENALRFGDDMADVARALLDLPTTVSKHASSLNPAEAQQNYPDIASSNPPIQPLPDILAAAETLQSSQGTEFERGLQPSLPNNTWKSPIPICEDIDAVFIGLAHLDTTEW